ncbi:unnamed protein product [Closterium sp. NIES-53]
MGGDEQVKGGKESEGVEVRGATGGATEAAEEREESLPQRGTGAGRAGRAAVVVRVWLAREARWSAPLAVAPGCLGLPSVSHTGKGLGGTTGRTGGGDMAAGKAAAECERAVAVVDGSDGCSLTFLLTTDACVPVSGPPFPPPPHGRESVWVRLILPSSILPLPAPHSSSSLPTAPASSAPYPLWRWQGPLCVELWPATVLCNALPLPLRARLLPLQGASTTRCSEDGHERLKEGSCQEQQQQDQQQQQERDRGAAEVVRVSLQSHTLYFVFSIS